MKPQLGVVGLWHLGCTISICWSEMGYPVIAWDDNPEVVENLRLGRLPIYEPGLKERLAKNIKNGLLKFTKDLPELESCDFVFLAYDTPVLTDDQSDIEPLQRTIKSLAPILKDGATVIVSSQTPVGTCRKFRKSLQTINDRLELVYSPENIRLGDAINSYLNPGRIILGAETQSAQKQSGELFGAIPVPLEKMTLSSAEMVKHGINTYLATSITFANQLSNLCEVAEADIMEVLRGMRSDPRIGTQSYLNPGIGFSGGTLGRDLKVLENLNRVSGAKADFFKKVYEWNSERKTTIVKRVSAFLNHSLNQRKIGILGLTYKPGTSTLRRSLPVEIVEMLIIMDEGAQISVFDPKANMTEWTKKGKVKVAESPEKLIRKSEMVVLLTEWPEFYSLDWKRCYNKDKPQIVFDAKNFLTDLHLEKIGYHYYGIGRTVVY